MYETATSSRNLGGPIGATEIPTTPSSPIFGSFDKLSKNQERTAVLLRELSARLEIVSISNGNAGQDSAAKPEEARKSDVRRSIDLASENQERINDYLKNVLDALDI